MYSYGRNNPLKYTDPTGQAVQVCTNDQSGKQTCVVMSDPQYAAAIAGNNPGINAPAAGATAGPGGGLAIGGAITCGGAVCGSATYQEESMQDTTGDLVAIGTAWGVVTGARSWRCFPRPVSSQRNRGPFLEGGRAVPRSRFKTSCKAPFAKVVQGLKFFRSQAGLLKLQKTLNRWKEALKP